MGRCLRARLFVLAVASTALLVLPATARGQIPTTALGAGLTDTGVVHLSYLAPLGTLVEFRERAGGSLKPLGVATVTQPPLAFLPAAARWRCDRLVRRFEALAIAPDGARSQDSYDVRTPSCANRLRLSVPRRVARKALVRVRAHDRWKNGGIEPRLCITPPRARRACRKLAFPRAVDLASRGFRPRKRGLWRVELQLQGHRVRAAVAVGGARYVSPARLPTLLATGDSSLQGIDNFLRDRLARTATVRSEPHHGTAVSKGSEWLKRAVAQTKRYRQRTTVISVGGESYPMQTADGTTHECCDDAWVEEYRRRLRVMMKTYTRGGRARVLWLTIPTPSHPQLAAITGVINATLPRAAEGLSGVRIVRLDLLFTPNGYREYMPYRGQLVRVRQTDGGHLTAAGSSIAAEAIEKALRQK